MSTVPPLSTADTDLPAARAASGASYRIGDPTRVDIERELPRLLGGEAVPDAESMAESSVPAGVVAEVLRYLVEGGPANLTEPARLLSDTVRLTGEGFVEPRKMPEYRVHGDRTQQAGRPTVGVLFYRAHELSGNTASLDALREARGADALPEYRGSPRGADAGHYEILAKADALVATVPAAGGAHASRASAGGDEEAWDIGAPADLDIPVLRGLFLTSSRAAREPSDATLCPMDAAMQAAIPEFDGRLITVPFSFKEQGADDVPVYVADPERAARVAGIAVRHALLSGQLLDEFVMHIRDGLHVLGGGPVGEPRVNLVLAVLRASRVWGGKANALPSLRASFADRFGLVERESLETIERLRATYLELEGDGKATKSECSVSVHGGRRPGRSAAGAAAERGVAGGRRCAGARREGHREEHRRTGAVGAAARGGGRRGVPFLVRPRQA